MDLKLVQKWNSKCNIIINMPFSIPTMMGVHFARNYSLERRAFLLGKSYKYQVFSMVVFTFISTQYDKYVSKTYLYNQQ